MSDFCALGVLVGMMEKAEHIANLLEKRIADTLTDEERSELDQWLLADTRRAEWVTKICNEKNLLSEIEKFLSRDIPDVRRNPRLWQEMQRSKKKRVIRRWLPYTAAAVALIIGTATWLHLFQNTDDGVTNQLDAAQHIEAGGNKATLMFANGKSIELSADYDGVVVKNSTINYLNGDNLLESKDQSAPNAISSEYIQLMTPNGGQYSITLSDGTRVWLNAASSLKYPSSFSETSDRVVELEGEAYFSVTKNLDSKGIPKPFIVKTKGQELTVLGTEFNMNAYSEEKTVKTTLVEGKVKIVPESGGSTLLMPNEQATLFDDHKLVVQKVDVSDAIAWKNGKISLNGKTIEEVMNELSRWYNLNVSFEGHIPTGKFFGTAKRSSDLSVVLALLESAKLSYKIEGNELTVISKQ